MLLDDRSSLRDSPSLVALPSLRPESAARIWGGNRVLVGNMGRDGEVLENMGRDREVLENMGRDREVLENMGRDREVGENLEPAFSSLPPM